MPCIVQSLDHLVLTVRDVPRTVAFYQTVLGMQAAQFTATDGSQRWALNFGMQKINLHQAGQEFAPKARHPTPGSSDLCFITDQSIAAWQTHFAEQSVQVEDGPIRRTGAAGPLISLYIRDPDGNLLEVSEIVRD